MAKTEDAGFTLEADGTVLWQGALAARLTNEDAFHPRVTLLGNMGDVGARDVAQKRIEDWLTEEAGKALRDLKRLKRAVDDGAIKGLVRGIAYRLIEAGGVIPRSEVQADLGVLSPDDRRALSKFAVRIGTHALWLPSVVKPRAMAVARAFVSRDAPRELKGEGLLPAPRSAPSQKVLAAYGRQVVGRFTVPVEMLEDYADQQRKAGRGDLPPEALNALGWSESEVRQIRSALRPPRRDDPRAPEASAAPVMDENNPFAALMGFKVAEPEPARAPKRDKSKKKPKPVVAQAETGETDNADPAKKKRRRRRGKGGAGEGQAATEGSVNEGEALEGEAPEGSGSAPALDTAETGETKKKRRRRRKPKGERTTLAEGEATEADASVEGAPEATGEDAGEDAVEGSADGSGTPADPAKKKSRRRRKSKGERTPVAEGDTPAEGAAEASEASTEPAVEAEGETKTKRRRPRRRKPAGAQTEATPDGVTPEAAPAAETAPAAPSEPTGDGAA